jgi:hypothetical protein
MDFSAADGKADRPKSTHTGKRLGDSLDLKNGIFLV